MFIPGIRAYPCGDGARRNSAGTRSREVHANVFTFAHSADTTQRATSGRPLYPSVWISFSGICVCHAGMGLSGIVLEEFHSKITCRPEIPTKNCCPLLSCSTPQR